VERNYQLELALLALRDPSIRDRFIQASIVPSLTATMLSTPRSSWSGFRFQISRSARLKALGKQLQQQQ
jgi:hypothetical protein